MCRHHIHFSYLCFLFTIALVTSLTTWSIALALSPMPRGVSPSRATLYKILNVEQWHCLDGRGTIKVHQINDDYCDCLDGSDEPGTSACSAGIFHCLNIGHRGMDIPSSRVNDGVCDCCDGSDEYLKIQNACPNNCAELGRVELEQRRSVAETYKKGAVKRAQMIATGRQIREEREKRISELEALLQEQELLKAEKEQLKKQAETAESEAVELFRELRKEKEANDAATKGHPESIQQQATEAFMRYDTNKDGFVDTTELQVDRMLDQDRNGIVTVEEARYFLDERNRIDLDSFISLSWPRIKPMQMLAQGIFKSPATTTEHVEGKQDEKQRPNVQHENLKDDSKTLEEQTSHHSQSEPSRGAEEVDDTDMMDEEGGVEEEEEEEGGYDEEETDVGVGTVTDASQTTPEYDAETQHLIDIANEARNAYSQAESELQKTDQELKDLQNRHSKDYGKQDEFASLDGACFSFEEREYVYSLCPFDRAAQEPRNGGSETILGRWDRWLEDDTQNRYGRQKYSHGASCWNGPQRSALVHFKCGLETKITTVSEPNRCEYYFDFETPASCDEIVLNATEERIRDEL